MNKITFFLLFFIVLFAGVLRIYKLDTIPPGLYVDEVSIGYNAYTILQTGKDQYGASHPLWFKAFGEYKMPVYIYVTAMSIKFFGKNEFAIRIPSAVSGILTVFIFYFFLVHLENAITFKNKSKNVYGFALLGTSLLAISPWHIQFSRGGFEATMALFFYISGITAAIFYWKKKKYIVLLISFFLFALTIYTYDAYRILSPVSVLFVTIALCMRDKDYKKMIYSFIVFVLLLIPVIQFSFTSQGLARFSQTSAFSEYGNLSLIRQLTVYPLITIRNYLSFFSTQFLFISGDGIGRHQIPEFAEMFLWQLPFFLFGLYALLKSKSAKKNMLLTLLIITPIGAVFTRPSPHALRSLPMVLPLMAITAYGICELWKRKNKYIKTAGIIVLIFGVYEFFSYLHIYYVHYPKTNELDWGAAYKEVVAAITVQKAQYHYIVIDRNIGLAKEYIYFYGTGISPVYVDKEWVKPIAWGNKKVLYVRLYDTTTFATLPATFIKTVYLKNGNKDGFVSFWQL